MRKVFYVALAALATVICLNGCGGNKRNVVGTYYEVYFSEDRDCYVIDNQWIEIFKEEKNGKNAVCHDGEKESYSATWTMSANTKIDNAVNMNVSMGMDGIDGVVYYEYSFPEGTKLEKEDGSVIDLDNTYKLFVEDEDDYWLCLDE